MYSMFSGSLFCSYINLYVMKVDFKYIFTVCEFAGFTDPTKEYPNVQLDKQED